MDIKLLIVDDSAFMRKIITDIVEDIEGIKVVGIARNGLDALDKIKRLKPDIVTLDIEMPKLDGMETLRTIKRDYDIPVIMLSSISNRDTTIEALQIGAVDFIEKPKDLRSDLKDLRLDLNRKIKSVAYKKDSCKDFCDRKSRDISPKVRKDIEAVVIAASTGGPKALVYLISKLPKEIKVPIFIVQHMPKGFTTSFAERLNKESKVKVVEAKDRMKINKGTVYLAPGDYHMTIEGNQIVLNKKDRIYGVRPAADYLFKSSASKYRDRLLGIILTGMGRDGSQGMELIKENKGYNIAQSQESCVVYGMPRNAVEKGVVDEIMDLEDISISLNKLIKVK